MKVFLSLPFALMFIALSAVSSSAEFIQTGTYYQAVDGTARVIPTTLGIYFLAPQSKIALQQFKIEDVSEGLDAFLHYDHALNRYTTLYIGNKLYKIRGSFALLLGNMHIKVDNFANAYSSVEIMGKGSEPAILSFQAVTPVGNYTGRSAVAILSANQVFENISEIHPYQVETDGSLSLNGQKVSRHIGLDIQVPESPCISSVDDVVFLTQSELNTIRGNKDEKSRKKELADAIKKNKVNILKELVLLKATKDIIALDPKDSSIKSIRLVTADPKICEIKTINLH